MEEESSHQGESMLETEEGNACAGKVKEEEAL